MTSFLSFNNIKGSCNDLVCFQIGRVGITFFKMLQPAKDIRLVGHAKRIERIFRTDIVQETPIPLIAIKIKTNKKTIKKLTPTIVNYA